MGRVKIGFLENGDSRYGMVVTRDLGKPGLADQFPGGGQITAGHLR